MHPLFGISYCIFKPKYDLFVYYFVFKTSQDTQRVELRSIPPLFFPRLSKVPSVSMSEISHIPISRCSTVSRLDRIRTLWRSTSPLGVWKRQRCVASSSAGRRAAPGLCPGRSVDEASFYPVWQGWFTTLASRVRKGKKKEEK